MKSEHQKTRHKTIIPTQNLIKFLQDSLLENRIIEKLQEKAFPGAAIQQSSAATVAPKTLVPLPHPTIRKLILTAFQPCKYFGTCVEANYQPGSGHVPRGFLGATANLEDVEAVIVLAEPVDTRIQQKPMIQKRLSRLSKVPSIMRTTAIRQEKILCTVTSKGFLIVFSQNSHPTLTVS